MKKLGLIGGTGPESTIDYYRSIETLIQKKTGTYPVITIESIDMNRVLQAYREEDWDGLCAYMVKGLENLKAAGCDFAAFCGVTPHIVYDRVNLLSPIPVVSMIATGVDYAVENGFKKVALFAPEDVMHAQFFIRPFLEKGIDVIIPDSSETKYVNSRIRNEIEHGEVRQSTVSEFAKITRRLVREEKIEGVILGSTQLPIIFREIDLKVPYVDMMRLHIRTLVKMMTR